MKKVLVIEDEAQTLSIFLKCLEFEGFQAFGASNGSEGINLTQRHRPDLVVCDIMMPDMDGYAVLSVLRRSPQTAAVPLIFLTAKVTMADLRRGMDLGADDYLTKPCTVNQFLGAIATRLERHQELTRTPSPTTPPQGETADLFPDCPHLAPVFQFIEQHYRDAINLQDVAQVAGYSPAYLTNLVQEHTGRTIKRWIIERRMAEARQHLRAGSTSIRQVAIAAGYHDAGYFTRQFRQFHGLSPQEWRQKQGGDPQGI